MEKKLQKGGGCQTPNLFVLDSIKIKIKVITCKIKIATKTASKHATVKITGSCHDGMVFALL